MEDIEYANAYSEVLEIIKHISKEDYDKIPARKIELFETKANPNYKLAYNPLLTLEQQQVSKRAKTIIAILFRDYWATEEQREKIIKKQREDLYRCEQEECKKYNREELFKNKKKQYEIENVENNTKLVKYKENIFKRIVNKIKKLISIR